jgi:hypothetical protein
MTYNPYETEKEKLNRLLREARAHYRNVCNNPLGNTAENISYYQRIVHSAEAIVNETPLMKATREFEEEKNFYKEYCYPKDYNYLGWSKACGDSMERLAACQKNKEDEAKKYRATSPNENTHTIITETTSPVKNVTSSETTQEGVAEEEQNICKSCEALKTNSEYFSNEPILGAVNTFNEIKPSSYNTSLICIRKLLESSSLLLNFGGLFYPYSVHLLITGILI